MYVAVFPVGLHVVVVRVVGVLIRQHAHVLGDGPVALVLQTYGTAGSARAVVVEGVLQRQVLEVGVLRAAVYKQGGGGADALVLHLRGVHNEGLLHALAYQRDVARGYRRKGGLAHVVDAVGQEYLHPLAVHGIHSHHVEDVAQTAHIAGLGDVVAVHRLYGLYAAQVDHRHIVQVALSGHLKRYPTGLAVIAHGAEGTVARGHADGAYLLAGRIQHVDVATAILAVAHHDGGLARHI